MRLCLCWNTKILMLYDKSALRLDCRYFTEERGVEMIEVKYEGGKFLAKGTFSVGIAGVYENKDFDGDDITIDIELDELLADLRKEKPFLYEPLKPYLKDRGEDGAAIAKGLEDYYNHKEQEIRKNIKQINDCILYHIFRDLEMCGFPFWEIEEAIVPGWFDDDDDEEEEIYPSGEDGIYYWGEAFSDQPNNGTVEKPDVEGRLRKQYPMFNFDALYESMIPEGICLNGSSIGFQFSDGWDWCMIECGYLVLDENFAPRDWHNH